jgi:hypothetical protein
MLDIGIQLRVTDSLHVRASLQDCNGWQDKFSRKKASFSRVNSGNSRLIIFFAALAESDIGSRYDRPRLRSRIYQTLCVVLGTRRTVVRAEDSRRDEQARIFAQSNDGVSGATCPATRGDVTVHQRMVEGKIRKSYQLTAKGRRELKEVKERLRTLVRGVFR